MDKRGLLNMEAGFCLLAIQNTGSKTKAAKILNMSIDTLSKRIEQLEHEKGELLLVKDGRGTTLTPKAKEIVEKTIKVQDIFSDVVADFSSKVRGEVVISRSLVTSHLLFVWNDLVEFYDQNPNINIKAIVVDDFNVIDASIDIGIDYMPPLYSEYTVLLQQKINYDFFASNEYIKNYGNPENLEDLLENHRIIAVMNGDNYCKEWKKIHKKAKNICYETNHSFALREMMKKGVGIALMPSSFEDENCKKLNILSAPLVMSIYIFANKKTKDTKRVRSFIDYLKIKIDESHCFTK